MCAMSSQITSLTIVYSTIYSGADQRKQQSSTSLAFVWGIHRWPMNSPQKGPVTRKMVPFDGVIITKHIFRFLRCLPFTYKQIFNFHVYHGMPLDLCSLSHKTSYYQILRRLETAIYGFRGMRSLWNLTGVSAAMLPKHLSNFRAIQ